MKYFKKLSLVVLACLLCVMASCQKPKQTDEEIINEAITSVNVPQTTHQGLDLPSSVGDVSISWSSEESLAFEKTETFYVNLNSEYSFKVFATFSYKTLEISKTYTVKVEGKSDGVCNVAWDYFKKKIPTSTITNFYPYQNKEYNSCTATYKSFNTDVISDKGIVTQYNIDNTVLFNTYIKSPSMTMIYPSQVTVKAFTDAQRISYTSKWLDEVVETIKAGEGISFPTYNETYDTYINWYSLSFGLITSSGIIIRPINKTDVTIGCTITRGEASSTLEYKINDFGGDITMQEQLKLWGTAMLPTVLRGTKNTVGDDDHLTSQVRTNSNGVLNLITGENIIIDQSYFVDYKDTTLKNKFFGSGSKGTYVHPEVPQSVLDELFYEGYQMPNEQNILWIVVHESGMPHEGQDAELLAKLQYNTAYVTTDPREASWHYQVDEKGIYQSFDDSVICWHAGDGTSRDATGNNNGIGIEMCINPDGNYDGAMHMDAKLIARLLHKYNLTLDNVKRHYDFSGKICPNYMIQTGRWTEFLELVDREYMAYAYNKAGAKITWNLSMDGSEKTSAQILSEYFVKGNFGTYFNKPVQNDVKILVEIKIEYQDLVYTNSKEITLKKNESENE